MQPSKKAFSTAAANSLYRRMTWGEDWKRPVQQPKPKELKR